MTKKIITVIGILGVLLMIWIAVSFIDVNMHNDVFADDYKNYASWNFFEVFFGVKTNEKAECN